MNKWDEELIEKQREAYYRWSGKKDPGNILEKLKRVEEANPGLSLVTITSP